MHLKNWSLIENGKLIELAPAYDLLNTRLLIDDEEESALELDDKKSGFNRKLLIDYLGREMCGLNERMIVKTIEQLTSVDWQIHILGIQLSVDEGNRYDNLVRKRLAVLVASYCLN